MRRVLRPRIIAIFSFRYDAHLIPDLIANLSPIVDGWISWDDRKAAKPFTGDAERRRHLLEAAHQAGADWVLVVDPDERFEIGTAERIRHLALLPGRVSWTFNLREMFEPMAYRVDGIWGGKRRDRLFRIFDNQFPIHEKKHFLMQDLHGNSAPRNYRRFHSGLNIYHLKMIDPARRIARRDIYKALDPNNAWQSIGYDYLADDDGAVLEHVPSGRHYHPPHHEVGGLWYPDPATIKGEDDEQA